MTMSSKTASGLREETASAPAPRGLHEILSAAAVTVAETHKCGIDVAKPMADGRVRLEIIQPGSPANLGAAMGIALDVCGEAGHTHTVTGLFAGYDATTAWLRPLEQQEA
jgi:hypothetical protein